MPAFMNVSLFVGHVAKDIDLRRITMMGKEIYVVNVELQVPKKLGWVREKSDKTRPYFIPLAFFGDLAESFAKECEKGDKLFVEGTNVYYPKKNANNGYWEKIYQCRVAHYTKLAHKEIVLSEEEIEDQRQLEDDMNMLNDNDEI